MRDAAPRYIGQILYTRSRRGRGWNWVGVVSGLLNPNDSNVGTLLAHDWRQMRRLANL